MKKKLLILFTIFMAATMYAQQEETSAPAAETPADTVATATSEPAASVSAPTPASTADGEIPHLYDKSIHIDLNDALFYNILTAGNQTKLTFRALFANNIVGFGAGVNVAEQLYLDNLQSSNPDYFLQLIIAPFAMFCLFDLDLYFGLTPSLIETNNDTLPFLPYFGAQYTFPLIRTNKKGVCNNLTLRIGLEWYVTADPDPTANNAGQAAESIFGSLFATILPKAFLGLGYRFSYYY